MVSEPRFGAFILKLNHDTLCGSIVYAFVNTDESIVVLFWFRMAFDLDDFYFLFFGVLRLML